MAKHGVTEFLRAFEDVGQQFFDIESDFLVALDEQGNIERVNPAFARLLGYSQAEVAGHGLMRFVRVEDWAVFLRTFTTANPPPVRMVCKGQGEVGVKMIAFRFRSQKGYVVLRPIGVSEVDTGIRDEG